MSEKTAIINYAFKRSRFFFINTSKTAYRKFAETFYGRSLFVDIIPNDYKLDIDDIVVYGNRYESQIYGIRNIVRTMPIHPDWLHLAKQLIPRSKDRTDDLEIYNFNLNPARGDFQLIVMSNIAVHSLNDLFFIGMSDDSIGFDAEQFTDNKTPNF